MATWFFQVVEGRLPAIPYRPNWWRISKRWTDIVSAGFTLIGKFREGYTKFKSLRGIGKKINGDGHILRDAGFIERLLGASKEMLGGRAILMAI